MNTIEKSKPIKIKINNSVGYNNLLENNIQNLNINEFDLKSSCFDPTKFSPPNEFIMKLNIRMEYYNNLRSRFSE